MTFVADEMQNNVNQFVIDLCRLTHQLNEFNWRDRPEILAAVVQDGQKAYDDLLQRQRSLSLSPKDASMIQTMMNIAKAQLKFLRRWDGHSSIPPDSGGPKWTGRG